MNDQLGNLNIADKVPLITPKELIKQIPDTDASEKTVTAARKEIEDILDGSSKKKLLILGPCSIHDYKLAIDYAQRLKKLADEVQDKFFIVMRVYFEKPRTTTGWKGFINDPSLNDSFDIEAGLKQARKLLIEINGLGIAIATEALDPIVPQFIFDQISWYAIGARTAESQTHREMASGLSAPVGIKNGTDGSLTVALNGMLSISHPHSFLGMNQDGQCCVFRTNGNQYSHIVLRGGEKPNYDTVSIKQAEQAIIEAGLKPNILVDCSHGNSNKNHELQPLVFQDCIHQILEGNESIIGLMLESNIKAGNQKLHNAEDLEYGVSITDACIDWETTENAVKKAYKML